MLEIDPQGGVNRITIGGRPGQPGNLGGVRGDITLRGREDADNFVDVIDQSNPRRLVYAMDAQRLYRVDPAAGATTASIRYGELSLDGLDLTGGHGGNRFVITDTPAVADVNVTSGRGVDSVALSGTGGDLNIDLGGGVAQAVAVGDAAHPLDGVSGKVTVSAVQPVVAQLTDEAAAGTHQTVIDQFGATGISLQSTELEGGVWLPGSEIRFGSASTVDLRTGGSSFSTFVYGVPAGTTSQRPRHPRHAGPALAGHELRPRSRAGELPRP